MISIQKRISIGLPVMLVGVLAAGAYGLVALDGLSEAIEQHGDLAGAARFTGPPHGADAVELPTSRADNETLDNDIAAVRSGILILMALILAAAVGVVRFTSRSLLRPLRRMTLVANELRRGNLDLVSQKSARDELGQLSAAIDALAEHLRGTRRTDQARLRRVQQATQIAIDHLPDAVAVLNPEGEVEMANETAQRLFHLRPGVRPGREEYVWLSLLLDADTASAAIRDDQFDDALQVFDRGDERFFLPQAIPVRDGDRVPVGVIFVFSDVTRRLRAYEAHEGLLDQLSHELNTPVTSLRMAIHLLLEERVGALDPQQVELLLAARDDAERISRVTSRLIDRAAQIHPEASLAVDHPFINA